MYLQSRHILIDPWPLHWIYSIIIFKFRIHALSFFMTLAITAAFCIWHWLLILNLYLFAILTTSTELMGSMADNGIQRQLKAILSADVKGYSKLMGDDVEFTVNTITA